MVDQARLGPGAGDDDEISALDAANYCYAMSGEMAQVARHGGMEALALALEHVRRIAALSMRQPQPRPEKPAPDEAA